jgi:hypothetical protein
MGGPVHLTKLLASISCLSPSHPTPHFATYAEGEDQQAEIEKDMEVIGSGAAGISAHATQGKKPHPDPSGRAGSGRKEKF